MIKGRYTISGSITPRGKIQSNIQNTVLKGLSAYELAVKDGYVGTEEEWLASLKGETGEAGYTPQKGVDYFDGQDGAPGRDGHTPQKGVDYFDGEPGHSPVVTTSKSGNATTVYIDGEPAATILDGATGEKGEAGENGNGISSVILNQDYTLTINFSNGSSYTTTSIRGATGQKGDDGNGIVSIEKTATVENIDTYMITFTDGTTTTYDVENGAVTSINGQKGAVQIGVSATGDGLVTIGLM